MSCIGINNIKSALYHSNKEIISSDDGWEFELPFDGGILSRDVVVGAEGNSVGKMTKRNVLPCSKSLDLL